MPHMMQGLVKRIHSKAFHDMQGRPYALHQGPKKAAILYFNGSSATGTTPFSHTIPIYNTFNYILPILSISADVVHVCFEPELNTRAQPTHTVKRCWKILNVLELCLSLNFSSLLIMEKQAKVDLKDWGLAQSVRCLGQWGVAWCMQSCHRGMGRWK